MQAVAFSAWLVSHNKTAEARGGALGRPGPGHLAARGSGRLLRMVVMTPNPSQAGEQSGGHGGGPRQKLPDTPPGAVEFRQDPKRQEAS